MAYKPTLLFNPSSRKTIIFFVLMLLAKVNYCQYTFVNGPFSKESNGEQGRLYSVEIDRVWNKTLVTIEVKATKSHRFLKMFTGDFCRIESTGWTSDYGGGVLVHKNDDDNLLRDIRCGHGGSDYGWKKVSKGETRRYTLVFHPAIPPGLTSLSLTDNIGECHGYSFHGYTINNPRIGGTNWTETKIKNWADEKQDEICGIYEASDDMGYRIGCVKSGNEYILIYLGSKEKMSWWYIGDIKARLQTSATTKVFKANWYMADKSTNSDSYVFFDEASMTTIIDGEKTFYLKMYPTAKTNPNDGVRPNPTEWTGTGFAISNSCFATNYHVVEGSKNIKAKGIKGDLSKEYTAQIIATDKINDLAIIRITDTRFDGFGLLPYRIATKRCNVGSDVFVLGYPMSDVMGEEIKLTTGVISSLSGYQGDVTTYQISAPIQPGNSGGPLFNNKGDVVGITNAGIRGADNVGYAVKAVYLQNIVDGSDMGFNLPTTNTIENISLPEKVKRLKDFIFIVICTK